MPGPSGEQLADGPGGPASRSEERTRAAGYLDIWEQHISFIAVHGEGIMAPWFMR